MLLQQQEITLGVVDFDHELWPLSVLNWHFSELIVTYVSSPSGCPSTCIIQLPSKPERKPGAVFEISELTSFEDFFPSPLPAFHRSQWTTTDLDHCEPCKCGEILRQKPPHGLSPLKNWAWALSPSTPPTFLWGLLYMYRIIFKCLGCLNYGGMTMGRRHFYFFNQKFKRG